MDLDKIMEMDHVIRVHADGSVSDDVPNMHAPEVVVNTVADGSITRDGEWEMTRYVNAQGWQLLTGWTGQYSYNGPVMHPSEYVGGRLAQHILETPGYYVAVAVEIIQDEGDYDPAGWVVAYRED